jgi:fructan beta-fructosidase
LTLLGLAILSAAICASGSLYNEPIRPQFHFSPKANWMNDPNGLVYYEGEYHLFFQHNPSSIEWGNMTWGHAVSPDLVHWTELEPAIHPDKLGTIYSGSAVVDWKNTSGLQHGDAKTICAFYTAAGQPFTQCLSYSNDAGKTFAKYASNPILGHIAGDNRDPKVFWYAPGKHWVLALYLDGDEYAVFNSTDLKHWTRVSDLRFPSDGECPDLFELPVDGNPKNMKWVFVAGTGSYLVGTFDGKVFKPESAPFVGDYGANYYATQSYSDIPAADGRRIQFAWMRSGSYPGMPFNQQMNFPCECSLRTFPEGIRMCRAPVREIEKLRVGEHKWSNIVISPGENLLSGVKGELLDVHAVFELADAKQFGFELRGQEVSYQTDSHTLTCLGHKTELTPIKNRLSLRILLDRNSVETYADDGRAVFSSCFVPNGEKGLEIFAKGGKVKLVSMEVHELKSAWVR